MHNFGYKSALARRACRYSDARPPRKTDGILLESELPPRMRGKVGSGPIQSEAPLQDKKRQLHYPLSRLLHQKYASVLLLSMARHKFVKAPKSCLLFCAKTPRLPVAEMICTPNTGHPVLGVFLCDTVMSTRSYVLKCTDKENGQKHQWE